MRQIVLDTETTGLDPKKGHRIIEIGCVEIHDRRITGERFHTYINPQFEVDRGAYNVHGIGNDFLQDKPLFASIVDRFLDFITGAELVIHNAPFDVGFLDHELSKLAPTYGNISRYCQVHDTLTQARALHPGQKNNLDALCKRYAIDNTHRQLHGALLDAEILARLYLVMTSHQENLFSTSVTSTASQQVVRETKHDLSGFVTPVVLPTAAELADHEAYFDEN